MCDKLLGSWKKRPRYRTAWLLDTQNDPNTLVYPNSYASTICDGSTTQGCGSYYPDSTAEQFYYLPSTSCNPTFVKARSCQADYSSSPRKSCNKTRSKSVLRKTESQHGKKNKEETPKSTEREEVKSNDDPKIETNEKFCEACCKRLSATAGPSSPSARKTRINPRFSEIMRHSSSSCPYYEIAKASHLSCRPPSRTGLQQKYSHSNTRNQCSFTSRTVCPGHSQASFPSQASCPASFKSQDFCCGIQKPCPTYSVTCMALDDSKNYTSHCPALSQCPSFRRECPKPVPNITCFSTNPYNSNNVKSYSFECPGISKPSQILSTCLPHDVGCLNVCALKTVGMGAKSYKSCPTSEQYKKLCSCSQEHATLSSPSEKLTGSCCCIEKLDNVACRGGSCSSAHNHRELNSASESSCPFLNIPQKNEITNQCPALPTVPSSSKNVCDNSCPNFNQNSRERYETENKCNRISVSFQENEKKEVATQCPAFTHISSSSKNDRVKMYPFSKQNFEDERISENKCNYMRTEVKEIAVQCSTFANIPSPSEKDALNSCPQFKPTFVKKPATEYNRFKKSESKAIGFQCPAFTNMPSSSEKDAVDSYPCNRQNFDENLMSGKSNECCVTFKRKKTNGIDNKYCSHIRTPSSPETSSTHPCPHYTSKQDPTTGMMFNVADDEFNKNHTRATSIKCPAFTDIPSSPKNDHIDLLTCFKHSLGEMSAHPQSCSGKSTAPRDSGTKCTVGKCEDSPEAQLFCYKTSQENTGQSQSSKVQGNACSHDLRPTPVNFPTTYPTMKPGCKYCEVISNVLSILQRNTDQDENLDQCQGANSIGKMEENNTCELEECPANQNIAEKNSSQDTCTKNNCERI